MALRDKVKGLAINAFLGDGANRVRRGFADAKRRVKGQEERIEFYFSASDPYSYLLAQMMPRIMETYGVDCEFILVGQPAHDVASEAALLADYGVNDARTLAGFYDIDFPDGPNSVDDALVVRANQVLIIDRPIAEQLRAAQTLGAALWKGDRNALTKAMGEFGNEASGNVLPKLAVNYGRLRKTGHYWAGMLHFRGQWYWGIDRLHYLEKELGGDSAMLQQRSSEAREPVLLTKTAGEPIKIEFYHSLRSPYSYLALERTLELPDKFDIELTVKPVLPMVMRGFKVPLIKRMYIVRDAKREADRLGIPFGNICDPLGEGIARCLAVFIYAQREGKGGEFLVSVGRGAWSQALNIASDDDLKTIVERVGLSWPEAQKAIASEDWEKMAAENRDELKVAGMWGVPAYRAGTFTAWGQDRIEMLEDRLRRHFEGVAAGLGLDEPAAE